VLDNAVTVILGTMILLIVWILSTTSRLPHRLGSVVQKAISILYFRFLLWKQLQFQQSRQKENHNNNDSKDYKDYNDNSTVVATVSGIYIYPVKSMRAVSLSESFLDAGGLAHDRQFMVVYETPLPPYLTKWEDQPIGSITAPRYRYLTQRQCPVLATITATLADEEDPTKLILHVNNNNNDNINKQSKQSIEISLITTTTSTSTISSSTTTTTTTTTTLDPTKSSTPKHFYAGIWDETIMVEDMGDEAAAFLQTIINHENDDSNYIVRLVRQHVSQINNYRAVNDKFTPLYANTWWGITPPANLTDGYPLLVATETSLQEVNDRLSRTGKSTIPMNRFRPNIVLKSTATTTSTSTSNKNNHRHQSDNNLKAFDEDQWKVIAIGNNVLLAIVKACPRCKQCCTDQITGNVTEEPVEVMKTFRALADNQRSSSSSASSQDVFFAQNAISCGGLITRQSIRVGDPVRVLKRGHPIYQ
jgi:uncharacterized protein YcbX